MLRLTRCRVGGSLAPFQNIELFGGLTVLDNLMLARHRKLHYSFLHAVVYMGKASRLEAENRAYVEDIIDFMELEPYRKHPVGNLSYGVQKRVEVARALTLAPELLLLDEPMAGMNIEEKEDMVRFVIDIQKERHTTVVLVRARPGRGHGYLRSDLRARFWRSDRCGPPGRGGQKCEGGGGIHWRRLKEV